MSIPAAVLGLQGALNTAIGIYGIIQPANWKSQVEEKFDGSIPSQVASTLR